MHLQNKTYLATSQKLLTTLHQKIEVKRSVSVNFNNIDT